MKKSLTILTLLLFSSPLARAENERILLFLGDSLTSGYGVLREEGFAQLVAKQIKTEGLSWQVINGAESGSLTSAVLDRLKFHLKKSKPSLVFIATGGNDARQKVPLQVISSQLEAVLKEARRAKIPVVLAGMRIFPNLGPEYAKGFAQIFPRLARKYRVTFVPFLLEGVAGHPELNQADGFHPNAKGHQLIFSNIWPTVKGRLK